MLAPPTFAAEYNARCLARYISGAKYRIASGNIVMNQRDTRNATKTDGAHQDDDVPDRRCHHAPRASKQDYQQKTSP